MALQLRYLYLKKPQLQQLLESGQLNLIFRTWNVTRGGKWKGILARLQSEIDMPPFVGVPKTIADGMSAYRDVFCREAGFEHVSRYVSKLRLSENKTL